MKTVPWILVLIVILIASYWRISTLPDRVQDFLEEDYTSVNVQRVSFGMECSYEDFYFQFSGVRNNIAFKGDLCCEIFLIMFESCDILNAEPINSSQ